MEADRVGRRCYRSLTTGRIGRRPCIEVGDIGCSERGYTKRRLKQLRAGQGQAGGGDQVSWRSRLAKPGEAAAGVGRRELGASSMLIGKEGESSGRRGSRWRLMRWSKGLGGGAVKAATELSRLQTRWFGIEGNTWGSDSGQDDDSAGSGLGSGKRRN